MSTPTARGRVQRRPWRCRTSAAEPASHEHWRHLPDDGRPERGEHSDEDVEGRREGHSADGAAVWQVHIGAHTCAAQAYAGSRHLGTAPAEPLHAGVVLPNYIALFQRFQTQNRKYLAITKMLKMAAPQAESDEFRIFSILVIEIWTLKVETFSKNAILFGSATPCRADALVEAWQHCVFAVSRARR